jgi:hypothetical protein
MKSRGFTIEKVEKRVMEIYLLLNFRVFDRSFYWLKRQGPLATLPSF